MKGKELLDEVEAYLAREEIKGPTRVLRDPEEDKALDLVKRMRAERAEKNGGKGMDRVGVQKDPERALPIPKARKIPLDLILPVFVFLVGIYALSLSMPPVAIVFYGAVAMAMVIFMIFFTFLWVTRKVSIPYFSAWRKGLFLRAVFSGNDVLFRPQEWGSGVVFTADGELKSYLKRGQDLWRCGGVDICPVLDEAGVTADPKAICALEIIYNKGIQSYADMRLAYKNGEFKNEDLIDIPQPCIVPFARLKNYIMGVSSSSLLFAHTDYWAERKYRLRQGLLGEHAGTAKWILFAGIAIAMIIFALQMGGVKIL